MTKDIVIQIYKETENLQREIIYKRQKAYFEPFFNAKKPWASTAVKYSADFAIELYKILKDYQRDIIKVISTTEDIFIKIKEVVKAKNYKTHEYLDERYNRVVVDDIKDVLVTMGEGFKDSLKDSYDKYIVNGNVRDSAELVYSDTSMNFEFNKVNEKALKNLEERKIKFAKEVEESIEKKIKKQLVDGYKKGLSSYEIAENIKETTGFSYGRAERIARTETSISSNMVEYERIMKSDNIIGKEWRASKDDRVRPTHSAAHGQRVKKDEPFIIGSSKLMFPCDTSLGAELKEVINCRCNMITILKGENLDSNTVYNEKNVGTKEWLKNQSEEFQVDYLGGKKKRELFQADVLSLEESAKTIRNIAEENLPAKVTSKSLTTIFELQEKTAKEVIKQLGIIHLYGISQNKEMNVTINTDTADKTVENVYGKYGAITPESANYKEWLEDLDNAEPMSRIIMHNHNNESCISIDDLKFFFKRKSVKNMFVVDVKGNIYCIEKLNGVVYDIDKIIDGFMQKFTNDYNKLLATDKTNKFLITEKIHDIKVSLYKRVLFYHLNKAGVKCGEYM